MSENLPVAIRLAVDADLPFIRNSWLRNYHEHGEGARHVPNDVYFANAGHWGVVDRCLRAGATLVATPEGDDHSILGWACASPNVLHYVYVKAPFRRLGITPRLLALAPGPLTTCTHWTPVIREWAKRGHVYTFNPYLLERA